MATDPEFDHVISSSQPIGNPIVPNIAALIFQRLPHRDEDSFILLSHIDDTYVTVSLPRLRFVVSSLYKEFQEKNIKPGDTVLLVTLSVNTEVYTVLLFFALVSYGVRVLFPLFVETAALDIWVKRTHCSVVIIPEKEVLSLRGYDRQKQVISDIRAIAQNNSLQVYDVTRDFHLHDLVHQALPQYEFLQDSLVQRCLQDTGMSTESVIFTTSGSSGVSKLVLYQQGAFLRSCQSWQESGMYSAERLGGRSFLDIIPHTMSARALFNALWTGHAACIVNTEWIKQRPQIIFRFLVQMKPQVMTLPPASFKLILEMVALAPEVKTLAFSELRTVVSTAAPFSPATAEEMKKQFGLYLHNAYGTTETQQVLTTLLCEAFELQLPEVMLGRPLAGVTVGLRKFDEGLYQMFVKSPFGHSCILGTQPCPAEGFFYTGDIVRVVHDNVLVFVGREQKDFFKSGYGAKVPLSYLKRYYKDLYTMVNHIEFYAFETFHFSFGIAALIFVTEPQLSTGRITDKRTIQKYSSTINRINRQLMQILEPFEYDHQLITRFLLINSPVTYTMKGTVSGSSIQTRFHAEIDDLLHSSQKETGVYTFSYLGSHVIGLLLRYTPLRFRKIRSFVLQLLLRKTQQ